MKLASTLTKDLGQQYYLIDGSDCYIVQESHTGYWPAGWLPVTLDNAASARCKRFATVDADGIVRSDVPFERSQIPDMPFDGIVVGETVTLWHNHAGILNLITSGKRGRIIDCEATIERRQSWGIETVRSPIQEADRRASRFNYEGDYPLAVGTERG